MCSDRPRGSRREAAGGLCGDEGWRREPGERTERVLEAEVAGVHGACGLREAGAAAADEERKGGQEGIASAGGGRARAGGGLPGATNRGGGGNSGNLESTPRSGTDGGR